jgi:hypothetical protein
MKTESEKRVKYKLLAVVTMIIAFASCELFNQLVEPETPTEASIPQVGDDFVTLAWLDNSMNEQGFEVQSKIDGGAWMSAGTTSADVTEYQITGLEFDESYAFRVRAFNDAGNSDYSAEVFTRTLLEGATAILPEVSISSPSDGATVGNPVIVQFSVSDWDPETDVGRTTHLHPFVDGINLGAIYTTDDIDLSDLYFSKEGTNLSGFHTVTLKLANADHTFTGVQAIVEITVE